MESTPDQDHDLRPLVRAADIAEVCDVSSRHVLSLAARGKIPCVRVGEKAVRFVPSEVEKALGLPPGIIRRVPRRR